MMFLENFFSAMFPNQKNKDLDDSCLLVDKQVENIRSLKIEIEEENVLTDESDDKEGVIYNQSAESKNSEVLHGIIN